MKKKIKEEQEFKVMPWLRKVREQLTEEYYKNPKKYLAERRKLKPAKGVRVSKKQCRNSSGDSGNSMNHQY